jgi:hypothetical protein
MAGSHLNVREKSNTVTGSGNDETLSTADYGIVYYDCGGGSRTGVILEAGTENGQQLIVVNNSDASETITFAAASTSNVAGGDSVSIAQNVCHRFVWSEGLSKWIPHA